MSEKRTTIEYHFGKKWTCTARQHGESRVLALVSPHTKITADSGNPKGREKAPVYEGIGGFLRRKDFDFDAAARAAISAALNKAGHHTMEYRQ